MTNEHSTPRRVAALYDIHGNLPALEAVLDEVARADIDLIVAGGDVALGPMPSETLHCLQHCGRPVRFIRGNCEREMLTHLEGREIDTVPERYRAPIRWAAEQISREQGDFIASWPATLPLQLKGLGAVFFCHATPRDDREIFTVRTDEKKLRPVFGGVRAGLAVCGHTHMQFDRRVGDLRVANAGSVGMPFGGTDAKWLLLGTDLEFRSTPYDLQSAARRIEETAYPQAAEFVSRHVLGSPQAEAMLAAFEKAELC
jgi:predicted phosphodiesterase